MIGGAYTSMPHVANTLPADSFVWLGVFVVTALVCIVMMAVLKFFIDKL